MKRSGAKSQKKPVLVKNQIQIIIGFLADHFRRQIISRDYLLWLRKNPGTDKQRNKNKNQP